MSQYHIMEISQHKRALIVAGKICKYCFEPTVFVDSEEVYGRSFGNIYLCRGCKAWVGTHKGTKHALGSVANSELRDWRREAHLYFDFMWIKKIKIQKCSKTQARRAAYKWLAEKLNLDVANTHISWFEVDMCKKVIELCKPYYK